MSISVHVLRNIYLDIRLGLEGQKIKNIRSIYLYFPYNVYLRKLKLKGFLTEVKKYIMYYIGRTHLDGGSLS